MRKLFFTMLFLFVILLPVSACNIAPERYTDLQFSPDREWLIAESEPFMISWHPLTLRTCFYLDLTNYWHLRGLGSDSNWSDLPNVVILLDGKELQQEKSYTQSAPEVDENHNILSYPGIYETCFQMAKGVHRLQVDITTKANQFTSTIFRFII